jgi:hypothetical protein
MPDLRTRIADILADFGLHGIQTRDQAADAILEAVNADEETA